MKSRSVPRYHVHWQMSSSEEHHLKGSAVSSPCRETTLTSPAISQTKQDKEEAATFCPAPSLYSTNKAKILQGSRESAVRAEVEEEMDGSKYRSKGYAMANAGKKLPYMLLLLLAFAAAALSIVVLHRCESDVPLPGFSRNVTGSSSPFGSSYMYGPASQLLTTSGFLYCPFLSI
jgi:hypothetical protein